MLKKIKTEQKPSNTMYIRIIYFLDWKQLNIDPWKIEYFLLFVVKYFTKRSSRKFPRYSHWCNYFLPCVTYRKRIKQLCYEIWNTFFWKPEDRPPINSDQPTSDCINCFDYCSRNHCFGRNTYRYWFNKKLNYKRIHFHGSQYVHHKFERYANSGRE